MTSDPGQPVVMFALEWCEFCWSVRKTFAAYDIPYRSIDLDSVAYQEDNQGGKIRKAIENLLKKKRISSLEDQRGNSLRRLCDRFPGSLTP